jgi:hypothetical protein
MQVAGDRGYSANAPGQNIAPGAIVNNPKLPRKRLWINP